MQGWVASVISVGANTKEDERAVYGEVEAIGLLQIKFELNV